MNKDLLEKGFDLAKHVTSRPITTALTIIFMMSCILSIVIYQDRHALFNWYAAQQEKTAFAARLDETKFPYHTSKLMKGSGARSATIWLVDLAQNRKEIAYSTNSETDTRDRSEFFGVAMPFFSNDEVTNDAMVEMQRHSNKVVCYELTVLTDFDEHLKDGGVNWVCAISVPPDTGQFIGMITIGFSEQPLKVDEQFTNRMIDAANKITKYGEKARPKPSKKLPPILGTDY